MANTLPLPTPNARLQPILEGIVGDTTMYVYILHPGDHFPRFGGSSAGLLVRGSPSLIVRVISQGCQTDTEYNTFDKSAWKMIRRFMSVADGAPMKSEEAKG